VLLNFVLQGSGTVSDKRVSKVECSAQENNYHPELLFAQVQLLLVVVGVYRSASGTENRIVCKVPVQRLCHLQLFLLSLKLCLHLFDVMALAESHKILVFGDATSSDLIFVVFTLRRELISGIISNFVIVFTILTRYRAGQRTGWRQPLLLESNDLQLDLLPILVLALS